MKDPSLYVLSQVLPFEEEEEDEGRGRREQQQQQRQQHDNRKHLKQGFQRTLCVYG